MTSRTWKAGPVWLCFLLLCLLHDIVLAAFNPAPGAKLPVGPLGVTLDFAFATTWPTTEPNRRLGDPRPYMWSSHLTFPKPASEISDGMLWQMAEDAHHEMDADRLRYEIGHRQMPTVMTVLAWGNEVLLVSSQKGAKSFSYEIPNTPVAETLRLCQAVWRDTGQPDKPHFNDGKCGEIMAVHLYYIMHRRHLGLQKPQARIGTVGLAQGRIVRFPLCPLHKDPVPPGEWGCAVFRDAQGLIELDLDPIRTPNVHYDLEQLGPRVDQVQICNAPNTDPEVYL